MLIYVQLFGGVVQKTLPVDIKAECSIAELQKRILTLCPGISIKRCIFAGKQLDDQNKTIGQKEITPQCGGDRAKPGQRLSWTLCAHVAD